MWSMAASLGAPVTDPPGKVARSELGQADAGTQPALDGRDHVPHARPSAARARYSATRTLPGRQTRPRSFRSRSTIMTCSARSLGLAAIGSPAPAGPRALDRHRAGAVAARLQEELRRGRDDRPAVAVERVRPVRVERGERRLERARRARGTAPAGAAPGSPGRRRRGRSPRAPARPRRVLGRRSRSGANAPARNARSRGAGSSAGRTRHAASGSGHGSGGCGSCTPAGMRRQAVAEVEVGEHADRRVGAAEAVAGQEALDLLERVAGRRVETPASGGLRAV